MNANELELTLFPDSGYTWNDILVQRMTAAEMVQYFLRSAEEEYSSGEFEVAYHILRELVLRDPTATKKQWLLLAECAAVLGFKNEEDAARHNATILNSSPL